MTTTVVVEIAPGRLVFGGTIHARGVQRRDAPGRCVFGGDAVLDDERTAVAIVKWETTTDSNARIDVGVRIRGRPQWATQLLSFSPTDPEGERWRTVGFAIATTAAKR